MKIRTVVSSLIPCMIFVSNAVAQEKVGDANWKQRMQAMMADVVILLPFAFDESEYQKDSNQAAIAKSLNSLAANAASLKAHTERTRSNSKSLVSKIDPSIRFAALAFENEISSAQISFAGSKHAHQQSQMYLRSALSKCTICHTQSANGPAFKFEQFQNQFAKLRPPDRFLALVATRQFDEALATFSSELRDAKVSKPDTFVIDRQAKTALAIVVRVKRDPKATLKLIEEIETSKAASQTILSDLADWKRSVAAWQIDKPINPLKDRALFDEATRLVRVGDRRENSSGNFENANVPMLRASTMLHDLLTNFPNSPLRPEAYLLLAKTYDSLPGFSLWDLSEEYLGACIEESPHTEVSERCFKKYQELTILGYSGSSGINVPSAIAQHLERLKQLATRQSPIPKRQ